MTRKVPLLLLSLSLPETTQGWLSIPNQSIKKIHSRHSPVSPDTNLASPSTTLFATGKGKKAQQRKIDDFVDFMEAPLKDGRLPVSEEGLEDIQNDPLVPLVSCIVKAADMRKAEDIRAIRVSKLTATTSFIVLANGNSRPQNQAIAAAVKDSVEEFEHKGRRTKGNGVAEGSADSGWILLDYGDVMVHIMTPKSRLFYDIEGKWSDGEDMDLSDLLIPNTASDSISDPISGRGMGLEEEEDPFWS